DAEYQVQSSDDDNVPSIQGKERILLVDDEEFILSSLQRTLRQSGYRVTALKNGMEALIVFNEKSDEFDLVITDLTMPGMTGLELSSKLQDVRPEVPIILCTGYNDVISRQEAKSYGIKELVLKPTGTGELRKVVRRILENCHS
ncbi:MAG TPA: response regulator, partial [Deltaproteobacteria bacterium]|nr:response regulator [Deltaproteobacteria bacterium]